MTQQTKETQERSYVDDPKMTQYKQNAAHHLALYNNIHADDDTNSTRPQENPFIPDDSYDATYANMDMNCNQAFASDAESLAPSLAPAARDTLRRHMHTVHEIEYETAVAPIDHVTDDSSTDSLQSSAPSVSGSANTYLTGGSTQNLVTPKGTLRKKSSVSFIDSGSHVDDYRGSQVSWGSMCAAWKKGVQSLGWDHTLIHRSAKLPPEWRSHCLVATYGTENICASANTHAVADDGHSNKRQASTGGSQQL